MKIGQKERGKRHVTYFLNFAPPPPNISGTDEDTILTFCTNIDLERY